MNKLDKVKALLADEQLTTSEMPNSFYTIGKVYAFRTITMIYTGRLVAENESCFVLENAAWIPETDRWASFTDTGAHKEAEPYKRPVILHKSGMLDATEIPSAITVQK